MAGRSALQDDVTAASVLETIMLHQLPRDTKNSVCFLCHVIGHCTIIQTSFNASDYSSSV